MIDNVDGKIEILIDNGTDLPSPMEVEDKRKNYLKAGIAEKQYRLLLYIDS